jgi:hypothetical protein
VQGGFSPLTVKWADPNLTEKKRKAAEISEPRKVNSDNTQVPLHPVAMVVACYALKSYGWRFGIMCDDGMGLEERPTGGRGGNRDIIHGVDRSSLDADEWTPSASRINGGFPCNARLWFRV